MSSEEVSLGNKGSGDDISASRQTSPTSAISTAKRNTLASLGASAKRYAAQVNDVEQEADYEEAPSVRTDTSAESKETVAGPGASRPQPRAPQTLKNLKAGARKYEASRDAIDQDIAQETTASGMNASGGSAGMVLQFEENEEPEDEQPAMQEDASPEEVAEIPDEHNEPEDNQPVLSNSSGGVFRPSSGPAGGDITPVNFADDKPEPVTPAAPADSRVSKFVGGTSMRVREGLANRRALKAARSSYETQVNSIRAKYAEIREYQGDIHVKEAFASTVIPCLMTSRDKESQRKIVAATDALKRLGIDPKEAIATASSPKAAQDYARFVKQARTEVRRQVRSENLEMRRSRRSAAGEATTAKSIGKFFSRGSSIETAGTAKRPRPYMAALRNLFVGGLILGAGYMLNDGSIEAVKDGIHTASSGHHEVGAAAPEDDDLLNSASNPPGATTKMTMKFIDHATALVDAYRNNDTWLVDAANVISNLYGSDLNDKTDAERELLEKVEAEFQQKAQTEERVYPQPGPRKPDNAPTQAAQLPGDGFITALTSVMAHEYGGVASTIVDSWVQQGKDCLDSVGAFTNYCRQEVNIKGDGDEVLARVLMDHSNGVHAYFEANQNGNLEMLFSEKDGEVRMTASGVKKLAPDHDNSNSYARFGM